MKAEKELGVARQTARETKDSLSAATADLDKVAAAVQDLAANLDVLCSKVHDEPVRYTLYPVCHALHLVTY